MRRRAARRTEKQRLDKFLCGQSNELTRSTARTAVRKGLVSVNGNTVKDPSAIIDAEKDAVSFKGQALQYKKFVYIIMNKPSGVLTAASDKTRKTVLDIIPPDLSRAGLAPVGRLDKDTTGLLLITDDGELTHRIISPKYDVKKTYIAYLDGDITDGMIKLFSDGVTLADGYKCRPALLEKIGDNTARITVSEGKYHQIKRMFGVVGLGVNRLHRESIGTLAIPESLGAGGCLEIDKSIIEMSIFRV